MIKLFLGFQLSTELSIHLNQSKIWKEVSVIHLSNPDDLIEVTRDGNRYVGLYLPQASMPISEIQHFEKIIQNKLHFYCPDYQLQKAKILLFSQVLIQ